MDKSELTEQAIAKALEWASAAEGFVAEQAPELCNEIVAFGKAKAIAAAVCVLLAWLVQGVCMWAFVCADGGRRSDKDDGGYAMMFMMCALLCLMATIALVYKGGMVWFAPRLYVLEVLRGML